MDLIYMDKNNIEKGVLQNYSFDLDAGVDNDFEIAVGKYNNVMTHTDRFYFDGTEYGGIVDKVRSDTKNSKIYYSGRSWRGVLKSKIIRPLLGDDYYVVSGEANAVLGSLISYLNLGSLFTASEEVTGLTISSYAFNRYTDGLSGINAMLATVNARLKLVFSTTAGKVVLSAESIVDYSDTIEYSSDSKVYFVAEDNQGGVNHLICLGSGELSARQVVDLYVQSDGTIGSTQYYTGLDEIVNTFDYANVESLTELVLKGRERFAEIRNSQKIELTVSDMELELGDIIAGREEITGMYISTAIKQKIVRIKNNTVTIEYKVGE